MSDAEMFVNLCLFILGLTMIIAQCQLFGIKRHLARLVELEETRQRRINLDEAHLPVQQKSPSVRPTEFMREPLAVSYENWSDSDLLARWKATGEVAVQQELKSRGYQVG